MKNYTPEKIAERLTKMINDLCILLDHCPKETCINLANILSKLKDERAKLT